MTAAATPDLTHARLQGYMTLCSFSITNLLLAGWWLSLHRALPDQLETLTRPLHLNPPPAFSVAVVALLGAALPGAWAWRLARVLGSAALISATWHTWIIPGQQPGFNGALLAPWTGLLISAALLGACIYRLRDPYNLAALTSYQALRQLGPELAGFRIIRHPNWPAFSRHLLTPTGEHLILHVTPGIEKGPRQQVRVTWKPPTETTLSRRKWPGPSLLWVVLNSARARYEIERWPNGLGLTYPANVHDLADHLLSQVPAAFRQPQRPTPAPEPRSEEHQDGTPMTPRQIRALGQEFLRDIPGMLRALGNDEIKQTSPSTFLMYTPKGSATIGVWPHPDYPSTEHPDWELFRQLHSALERTSAELRILWAPLLSDVGRLQYTPLTWQRSPVFAQGHAHELRGPLSGYIHPEEPPKEDKTPPYTPQTDIRPTDPYEVLGVPQGASQDEIKTAWRRLAKQYHPDRAAGLGPELKALAEQRMKEINAAYERLGG